MKQKSATESDEKTLDRIFAVFKAEKAFDYLCGCNDIKKKVGTAFGCFFGIKTEFIGKKADCNNNVKYAYLFCGKHHIIKKHRDYSLSDSALTASSVSFSSSVSSADSFFFSESLVITAERMNRAMPRSQYSAPEYI